MVQMKKLLFFASEADLFNGTFVLVMLYFGIFCEHVALQVETIES